MITLILLGVVALEPCMAQGIGDIPKGSRGWGLTVFEGVTPDTFGVEIVGTIRGTLPGENRLLVRLTGARAESIGVASGMSGSPIFVDGRLVGALASTFAYLTEPLGLVTPLDAMLRPGAGDLQATTAGTPLPLPGTAFGFHGEALAAFNAGMPMSVSFSAGGRDPQAPTRLAPGDMAAVLLVDGDWALSVMGTVTWRDGDRLAAFGHQLFGLGEVELPLAGASVVATIRNRAVPFKMSNPGDAVGTITYDGVSGSLGTVGRHAPTVPLRIAAVGTGAGSFDLRLALHPLLTPVLLRTCVQNCTGMLGGGGSTLCTAALTVHLSDGTARTLQRAASGPGALNQVAEELAQIVDAVMNCPLGRVESESLSVRLSASFSQREYYLESVDVEPPPWTNHEAVVTVRLLSRDTSPLTRRVSLKLPPGTEAARLRLLAGDAASAVAWERERALLSHIPASVEEYLDELFSSWSPDCFYLFLMSDGSGWSTRRGEVSTLPPTMARVLRRATQQGKHDLTTSSVLSSAAIRLDGAVRGSAIVDLSSPREGHRR